jgi:hypothetical protein
MGWVFNTTPQPQYFRETLGTHCIGDWVSLKVENLAPTGI